MLFVFSFFLYLLSSSLLLFVGAEKVLLLEQQEREKKAGGRAVQRSPTGVGPAPHVRQARGHPRQGHYPHNTRIGEEGGEVTECHGNCFRGRSVRM